MNIKGIVGAVLAFIVGFARLAGGIVSIHSSSSPVETWVGIVLILVGVFIALSTTMLVLKKSMLWFRMLTAAVVVFWIDGIVNGFLLFGSPQLSGQIINICCVAAILWLTRSLVKLNV